MSEAKYELVDVDIEGREQNSNQNVAATTTNTTYPGFLRTGSNPAPGPPAGMIFVKTGGNALQAIDPSVLEQESILRVIVPAGKMPGDSILVRCPHVQGRFVPTNVPLDAKEGSEFLIRIPPLKDDKNFTTSDAVIVGANIMGKEMVKGALLTAAIVSGVLLL